MLKPISPQQAELGMFIHKFQGNWFLHPFWRTRFLLTDEADLATLRASAVRAVVIDTGRGCDVGQRQEDANPRQPPAPQPAQRPPRRAVVPAAASPAPALFDLRSLTPQSTTREFGHATRIATRGNKVISKLFIEARLGKTIKASQVEPVIEDIFASVQRNPHAFNGLMRCKRSNGDAYHHALAVSALMISLARQMKFSPELIRQAGLAGLMIDIGIGHLPIDLDAINGDVSRIDPRLMREHAQLGYDLLVSAGLDETVARACLEHHERVNGSGYPRGLKGVDISPFGRMAAICDSYDTLCNDRPGGAGLNPALAIARMQAMDGAFNSGVMEHFIEVMGIYPLGSVVMLRSGRLALVIDQGPSDPARPMVRTFYSAKTAKLITPVDIRLWDCYGEDGIESGASAEDYGICDFGRLREKLLKVGARG